MTSRYYHSTLRPARLDRVLWRVQSVLIIVSTVIFGFAMAFNVYMLTS